MLRRRFRDVHEMTEIKEKTPAIDLRKLGVISAEFPETIDTYFDDNNEMFYIDDHGTPFATEFNRLLPNIRFEIDGVSYHTDDYGRIDYISANKARGYLIKALAPEIAPHVDMWNGMLNPAGKWTHFAIYYNGDDERVVNVEITHEW